MFAPDAGGGGAAFAGISDAVAGVVEAANAGFAISENGGQPLLHAIEQLEVAVADALRDSIALEAEPALGSTPNAKIYKPFIASVASDHVQGAIPVLKKLHQDLINAHAAVQKAMNNYQNTEHVNASTLQA
jgi:hypothetical protein